jgi:hypothetical protein
MKYVIYVIAEILDILSLAFLLMYPSHLYAVLIVHLLLFIIMVICYKRFENTIKDLPLYLILCFPGIGGLYITLLYFSSTYFYRDNLPLSDYEQMLEAEDSADLREKISYENEIRTMSFLDLLNYIGPEQKKELLIDSQYSVDINNTEILKKGLEAEDKEVQHYSATLLNTRENEYTNRISELSEQFVIKEDESILNELIVAYKSYIDSGLIEEDSMGIFLKEYIQTLNKKIRLKNYGLKSLNQLFEAYVKDNNLVKAEEINNKIRVEFNREDQVALNEIFILYQKDDHEGVFKKISSLDPKIIESNSRLKDIKDFFGSEVV